MTRWKRIVGFALSMFCVHIASAGAVEIRLASIPWLFEDDEQGVYDQVLTEAIQRAKVSVQLKRRPPKRARSEFEAERNSCYSPANKSEYAEQDEVIASVPFNLVKVLVLTRKGDALIRSAGDLENKMIGVVRGLRFDALDGIPGLALDEAATNEQALKKLLAGRNDAMVDYAPDILLALREIPDASAQVQYDPNYFLFSTENSVICFRTAENEAFLQAFNSAIEAMKADGTLRKILGDAYLFEE